MSKQLQVNPDEFKKNEQVSKDVFEALKAKLSDRDLDVMRRANEAFIDISNNSMNRFQFKGSGGTYGIAGVGTQEFVLNKLIELSNLGQDTFTFLDIGAGYHGCGRDIAKYINKNKALFPNIKHVEIVSLSGDNSDARQYKHGICRVSEISRFKIEEIGRWINPSDEMIKAYETIIENNDDYTKLVDGHKKLLDFINKNGIEAIRKLYEPDLTGGEPDLTGADDSVLLELIAHDVIKAYEELATIFKEKYGMDVSINVDALVKNKEQELSRLAAVIADSNIQVKLNIQASRELETLKKIKSFNLPESFDYATSSWCFRHLTDPVGTLVQTHNILNPKGGMLHADGFLSKVKLGGKEMELTSTMRIVLHSMKMPYIFDPKDNNTRRAGGYILTRNSTEELSLNYQHLQAEMAEGYGISCELISAIDLKADVEVLKQELFSKNGYRSSPYEDIDMALNGSALEKYNYSLGTERYFATEPKYFVTGVVVKSAETALLLGKLKLEGINVGTERISAKQYEALFNFIKQEYPDLNAIKQDDQNRELIMQYMVYDIVKNTSSKTLKDAFSQYPNFKYGDYINEHCLFLATINGNTDLFSEIHGILNVNEHNLNGGSNIDLSKMYIDTLELIDNNLKKNDYQSIKTILKLYKEKKEMGQALLSMALDKNLHIDVDASMIGAIISELEIKLTEEHIQQYFNNSPATKGNNIIQSGFATMDDFVSIGDIQKIDALTSYDAEYEYKNTGQTFAELSKYDTEKIKFMTSSEVRTIVNDRKYVDIKLIGAMYDQDKYFTQFIVGLYDAEQQKLILESDIVRNHFGNNPFSENKFNLLNKMKQDFRMEKLEWVDFVNFSEKKLELLSSDSFKKLLKDKKVTLEELSALPEDKLEAMSSENIILLILNREASLPFKAISELSTAQINVIAKKTSGFTKLMAAPKAEFDEIVGKTELSSLKKIAEALRGQIAERTQASPAEKTPTSPNVNSRRGSLDLR